jgi:hypothetical protein
MSDPWYFFFFLVVPELELRASHLLGFARQAFYHLSHSTSPDPRYFYVDMGMSLDVSTFQKWPQNTLDSGGKLEVGYLCGFPT